MKVREYKNLRIINLVLCTIIIMSFLNIRISEYMGAGSSSLFTVFWALSESINQSLGNYPKDARYRICEMLIIFISMLFASIFSKKIVLIIVTILLMGLWFVILHFYGSLFDEPLYIRSSIPFLISSILMISVCVYGLLQPR
jgi:hypothetical protein